MLSIQLLSFSISLSSPPPHCQCTRLMWCYPIPVPEDSSCFSPGHSAFTSLNHRDSFRDAHMTQAKPRRLISRTFVGTKERENFSFLVGLGARKRRFWSCHDVKRRGDLEPWLSFRIQLLLKLSDMSLLFQLLGSIYIFLDCLSPLSFFYLHLRE